MTADAALPLSGIVEIEIPSSVDLVTVVRMVIASAATAGGSLDGDRLDDLRWVTSEATTNAIQANQRQADDQDSDAVPRVMMRCEVGADFVELTVTDGGPGLSGTDDVPDMTHPDRLLLEGGFGVPLMQKLTRGEMEFTSSSEGTTLALRVNRD